MEAVAEDAYDEGEHVKEVFAYFGRAFYEAGVLETGLAIAIMQMDFLSSTMGRIKREGMQSFDRAAYEAKFDTFMDHQHAQTLGNLIKRAQGLAQMPDETKRALAAAKDRRDFLTHHFFRERAVEFATRLGRDGMIAELEDAHGLFASADRAVDEWGRPQRIELGLTDEAFDRFYAKWKASLALGEPA